MNHAQRSRLKSAFFSMVPKRPASPSKETIAEPLFFKRHRARPIEEPRVIVGHHSTGPRVSMAKVPGAEVPGKPGFREVKTVPVCRWRCRHVNTRHRASVAA